MLKELKIISSIGNSRSSEENNRSWERNSVEKSPAKEDDEKRQLILSTIRPSVASNDTNSNTNRSSKEMISK
jgi:hypothetical protein